MPAGVKRTSPPGGAGRGQARTRLARRAVVDAARELFLERGYAASTVDAISERADVPAATVYRLFSSKLGILKALLDVSIAGDDQPVSVQERPDVSALFAETDPGRLLAGFAGVTVSINMRISDVYRILVSAAGSDPAAATLLADYQRQRAAGQGGFARSLARGRSLRPGLGERDAADVIHALMSPELYRLLVVERAWPPDRYRHWLTGILGEQLIGAPGGSRAQR
ncbi:MAG TPA: helix-turn-helix domain-containing protein [Candidatus Dormibacteraeota bacterium]|nr:helix-turn-helix domain-containing protein [Candidatus Dormibacteraeota bacterium]